MSLNSSKVLIAAITLVCVTVLMVTDSIDASNGDNIITAIIFYILGNGVTALRGRESTPVVGVKSPHPVVVEVPTTATVIEHKEG